MGQLTKSVLSLTQLSPNLFFPLYMLSEDLPSVFDVFIDNACNGYRYECEVPTRHEHDGHAHEHPQQGEGPEEEKHYEYNFRQNIRNLKTIQTLCNNLIPCIHYTYSTMSF